MIKIRVCENNEMRRDNFNPFKFKILASTLYKFLWVYKRQKMEQK